MPPRSRNLFYFYLCSVAAAAAAFAAISASFFPFPFLPPPSLLHPIALHLLSRLQHFLAFLTFTAAAAAAIFSSQRHTSSPPPDPALADPLPTIFREAEEYFRDLTGSPEDRPADDRAARCVAGQGDRSVSRTERSRDAEWGPGSAQRPQRKQLHRRASSLNDSVDYEPEPLVAEEEEDNGSAMASGAGGDMDDGRRQVREEDEVVKVVQKNVTELQQKRKGTMWMMSSDKDEVNRQADEFIAKFKEKMRLQRLDSFQRYRRKSAAAASSIILAP